MDVATIVIDKAGRLVLPKAIRDGLGLRPGSRLVVEMRSDHLELRPVEERPTLAKDNGWWVHQGSVDSAADVEEAVRRHRVERLARLSR
jgi:AbrB family looped-hinge helix DNA binding protein